MPSSRPRRLAAAALAACALATSASAGAEPVPDTTITSGPSGLVGSPDATFSFASSEPDSTFECALDSSGFSPCDSPAVYGALDDGNHQFEVRAVLGADTDPTPAVRSWTIDTVPPDTIIDTGSSGYVAVPEVTFWFHATEAGSELRCTLDGGAEAACASPQTYSNLSEGPHAFRVRAVDPAGNLDPTPAERTFSVDTTRPEVAFVAPAPGFYNGSDEPLAPGVVPVVKGKVTVEALVRDLESGIIEFQFQVDGVPVPPGSVTYNPAGENGPTYSFIFRRFAGVHNVVALARNGATTLHYELIRIVSIAAS